MCVYLCMWVFLNVGLCLCPCMFVRLLTCVCSSVCDESMFFLTALCNLFIFWNSGICISSPASLARYQTRLLPHLMHFNNSLLKCIELHFLLNWLLKWHNNYCMLLPFIASSSSDKSSSTFVHPMHWTLVFSSYLLYCSSLMLTQIKHHTKRKCSDFYI